MEASFQASVCIIPSNILLTKASHVPKPRVSFKNKLENLSALPLSSLGHNMTLSWRQLSTALCREGDHFSVCHLSVGSCQPNS